MGKEIENIVKKIGDLFEDLEEYLKRENLEKVDIKFPRGVIRTAREFKMRLGFIYDEVLKTNIAYHLMLTDVYRWILNRFDIALVAREMLIKEGISLLGNITEAIVIHLAKLLTLGEEETMGFSKACSILVNGGVISKEMKKELEWVWGLRCREHIANLPGKEYGKYTLEHYNKTILIWQALEKMLQDAKAHGKI